MSRKQKVVEDLKPVDENPEVTPEEETPTEQGDEPEVVVEKTESKGKRRLKKAAPFLIGAGTALAVIAGSRLFGGGNHDAYVSALDREYGDKPDEEDQDGEDQDNQEEPIDEETAD